MTDRADLIVRIESLLSSLFGAEGSPAIVASGRKAAEGLLDYLDAVAAEEPA